MCFKVSHHRPVIRTNITDIFSNSNFSQLTTTSTTFILKTQLQLHHRNILNGPLHNAQKSQAAGSH